MPLISLQPFLFSSSSPSHPLNDAQQHVSQDRTSPNLLRSRVCSQRVSSFPACSCSNSALFPFGGQECMHVSPYPSGSRWNRPQRSGVRQRERTGFPPHPSLFTLLSLDLHSSSPGRPSLWTARHCQPTIARGSENAPEEISLRQLSFMTCSTSGLNGEDAEWCSSMVLFGPFLPLLVKYTQPFSSEVSGSIKPGNPGQS